MTAPISWEGHLVALALHAVIQAVKNDANPYFRHSAQQLAETVDQFAHLHSDSLQSRIMAEIELYQLLKLAVPLKNLDIKAMYGALDELVLKLMQRPHHGTYMFLRINTEMYINKPYPHGHQVKQLIDLLELPSVSMLDLVERNL